MTRAVIRFKGPSHTEAVVKELKSITILAGEKVIEIEFDKFEKFQLIEEALYHFHGEESSLAINGKEVLFVGFD